MQLVKMHVSIVFRCKCPECNRNVKFESFLSNEHADLLAVFKGKLIGDKTPFNIKCECPECNEVFATDCFLV